MIGRRGFLGGLAGILAAGSAPAIIHNAMKIHVPKKRIEIMTFDFVTAPGFAPDLSEWVSNQAYVRRSLIETLAAPNFGLLPEPKRWIATLESSLQFPDVREFSKNTLYVDDPLQQIDWMNS